MSDLELIVQAAELWADGSDNCNQIAAAIQRHTEAHTVLIQQNKYLESSLAAITVQRDVLIQRNN